MTTTEPTSAHRCRRGRDCPGRERTDDGELVGAAVELPGLCDADRALLERILPELPHLWLSLRGMLVPGDAADDSLARGTRTPPLPLRVDPLVTAELMLDELTRWEEVLRDRMGMNPAPGGRSIERAAIHVKRASRLLAQTVPSLLALGPTPHMIWQRGGTYTEIEDDIDGYDAAVRLLALHRTAQRVAGHSVLVHHLPAPCPVCEAQTLRRLDGDDYVRCSTCGTVSTEDQYDWLVLVLAYDLGTAS